MKPIVLDICCREGGATRGLQRAGFHVLGVDVEPRKSYPGDAFIRADGIEILRALIVDPTLLAGVAPVLVWQSWPCQEGNAATIGTNASKGWGGAHEQFIPRARELSDKIGIPYVLEQPASSRKGLIRRDLTLCMDTFKGDLEPPWVQKHRSFEISGFAVPQPKHAKHAGYVRGWRHGVRRDGPYVAGYGAGGGKATVTELRHAMGIDWMTDRFDLCEAIPPAYAEYIGRALLAG